MRTTRGRCALADGFAARVKGFARAGAVAVRASTWVVPGDATGGEAIAEDAALADDISAVAAKPGCAVTAIIKAAAQRPEDILSGIPSDIRAGFRLLLSRTDEERTAMAAGSLDCC